MSEEDTIHLKKDTVYKSVIGILAVLLVVSIVTGGFGFGGSTGAVVNNGGATGNTGNTNNSAAGPVNLQPFTSNSELFPSLGPSNAKNTVIEFADFQCPYCALASGLPNWTSQYQSQYGDLINAAGNVEQMAKNGQLRFIFVPMSFLGQESVWAAQAGYCAANQGKFWQMHDAIYSASTGPQEDTGKYSIPNLEKIAAGISGIDTAKFNSCLENNDTLSQVQTAAAEASTAASGTPTFYVNGQQVTASGTAIQAAIK